MPTQTVEPVRDLRSLHIPDGKRGKPRGNGHRVALWAGLLVLLTLPAALFYLHGRVTPVETITLTGIPAQGSETALLNASGYVTPRRRATLSAKTTGRVAGVYVDEGTTVKQGQIIAKLDDSTQKSSLNVANADRDTFVSAVEDYRVQLRNADLVRSRASQLVNSGVEALVVLDQAVMADDSLKARIVFATRQIAAAETRVNESQQALQDTFIYAPFSGVVVSRDAQVGEMVSPISAGGGFTRTGIVTLVDMNSLEIEVDVNEAYIGRIRADQPVIATLDAYPNVPFPSKVRAIIPSADRQKATVKVRISFLKPDPRILPDMGVKVSFYNDVTPGVRLSASRAVAFVIPALSIRGDNGDHYVYLDRQGRVERQAVSLGRSLERGTEVLAGLTPGDSVIVHSRGAIQVGQQVKDQSIGGYR